MAESPPWRVHTARLLAEIMENPSCEVLRQPLLIMDHLLRQVAARAIVLDDPELNRLMLRLTLYSVADPMSPDHDAELTTKLIAGLMHGEQGK